MAMDSLPLVLREGIDMGTNFTQSQLSLMSDADRADIARAEQMGFKKPCYLRMTRHEVTNEIMAYEQPFSPAALRIISRGQSYPESATRENCEKLISIWNKGSGKHYSMV